MPKLNTNFNVTPPTMINMFVAPWDGDNGRTYTLFGLDSSGKTYRYTSRFDQWAQIGTGELERDSEVRHNRPLTDNDEEQF